MDDVLRVLLDQNVPREITHWLRNERPLWQVWHASEVGLSGQPDQAVFAWAQQQKAIIVTFDEDFADRRMYPAGRHCGVSGCRSGLQPPKKPGLD